VGGEKENEKEYFCRVKIPAVFFPSAKGVFYNEAHGKKKGEKGHQPLHL